METVYGGGGARAPASGKLKDHKIQRLTPRRRVTQLMATTADFTRAQPAAAAVGVTVAAKALHWQPVV